MITYFPPPFIFKGHSKNHEQHKEQLVSLILSEFEKNQDNEYKFDYNDNFLNSEQYQDIVLEPTKELLKTLYDPSNFYTISKNKPKNIKLKDIWWVVYNSGTYAETHKHGFYGISGVYFLELNSTNTTNFIVDNPYPISDFKDIGKSGKENPLHTADYAQEGDVFLFPSAMHHYVNPVSERKLSIAFNLEILY
jgi:hypothetical protein